MAETKREYFTVKGMRVTNARRIPGSSTVSFSLVGKGIGLYNLRLVNSANGAFISTPSTKGKDNKYYPQYALYLTKEDEEKVIKKVIELLPADDEPGDTDTL